MSVLLEKEMPGRKRRLGVIWWLTGVAALVLIGAVAAIGIQNDSEETPGNEMPSKLHESSVPTAEPIAGMDKHSPSSTIDKAASHGGNNLLKGTSANKKSNNNTSKSSLASDEKDEMNKKTESDFIVTSSEKSEDQRSASEAVVSQEIVDGGADIHEVSQSYDVAEDVKKSESLIIELPVEIVNASEDHRDAVSVLTLKSEEPEQLSEPARLGNEIIPAAVQSGKPFEVQGLVAMHFNSAGSPFYGVEAGGAVVFRADKRLRVRTGLSYAYYSVDGIGLFSLSRASDVEELGGTGPGTGVGTPLYDPVSVVQNTIEYDAADELTDKFHYLHVPLRVEYRIAPRWSASAGVRMALLLAAPARYKLSDEKFSANYLASAPASRSFLYDYGILRKLDIAPELMLSWKATNRLWLDLGYLHGLVPYINRSDISGRGDYHRMIQVGARYTII
jgi:hypothetical protein